MESKRKFYPYQKEIEIASNETAIFIDINSQYTFYAILQYCFKKFTRINLHEEYYKVKFIDFIKNYFLDHL